MVFVLHQIQATSESYSIMLTYEEEVTEQQYENKMSLQYMVIYNYLSPSFL